jgi:integrase
MALKFTKLVRNKMRSLNPGETLTEHGIVYECLPDGDGRFAVNIMVDGQRVHRVIGKESEGVTRIQAESFIETKRTEARESRLNLPKRRKIILTLEQAAENYLELLPGEGGKDLKAKRRRLEQHLIPFFKSKPLSGIMSFEIERYKKFRQNEGASNGTINRELAVLSHLFSKSVEWKWIEHKPAVIKRLSEINCRLTYLTGEQIDRLIDAAKTDPNPDIYRFIVIGLETSMRRMEILSIRLKDIDCGRRIIFIPNAKAGAREQPITGRLADYLQNELENAGEGQEWLFPSLKSSTGHVVNVEKAFRRVVEKAGMDPKEVVRHTLRHTAITHLVQAGVDLPTVKRISGHKTLRMVERYSHQNGEHIQAAMDKLEKRYGKKAE